MANPTNPFNWQMPQSTDLVTDLPADFETFGQAVATSMADLLGGTTGQVLSKASNTDMDFTWVAQDDSNAIQNAIVDAKGDLIAASAADTPARLAVGNNGETLVADSSTATGLRYQPTMAAGKNTVINGGMDIWQRGTSIAGTTTSFSADRWQSYRSVAGSTFSRQTGPDAIQYCVRVQRDSGNSSTTAIFLSQNFETVNSIPLAGKTVTLSFYARKGADYSRSSSGLTVNLFTGTGTDQNGLTGAYTGSVTAINQTAILTTSWQRFTYSATLGSTATEINITYGFTPVGTAGAADYYEISGVQLEVGSVATEFTRTGGTIQGELAACQRYYVRFGGDSNYQVLGYGSGRTTQTFDPLITLPVTMRVAPTALDFSTLGSLTTYSGGATSIVSLSFNSVSTSRNAVTVAGTSSGTPFTVNSPYYLVTNNSTSGYLGFSAEL